MSFRSLFLTFNILFLLTSCFKSRETQYLLFEEPPEKVEGDARQYALKSFLQVASIDILFVVDNSGSMSSIQQNVAKNASLFMKQFALNSAIDWKIGVVSTDDTENPYLGFDQSFDSSLIVKGDPSSFDRVVDTFSESILDLGISGSPNEYIFYNTVRHIKNSGVNSFLRSNAHLVVIMITDEKEHTLEQYPANQYSVDAVINTLTNEISSNSVLRFYGALNFDDLSGCNDIDYYDDLYAGSPYEDIISQTSGFVISACLADFGNQLARIGEDIATLIKVPRLALLNRPKINTIVIKYKGEILKPGRLEDGGVWYYDYQTNTINFNTIDFVENIESDIFNIDFEVEDGIDRG